MTNSSAARNTEKRRFTVDLSWMTIAELRPDSRATLSASRWRNDLGVDLADDPILFLLVRGEITLSGTRSLAPADVAHDHHVSSGNTQARRYIRPRAHVLRLFLRPHDLGRIWIQIDDFCDRFMRPWIKLFDAHESNVRL